MQVQPLAMFNSVTKTVLLAASIFWHIEYTSVFSRNKCQLSDYNFTIMKLKLKLGHWLRIAILSAMLSKSSSYILLIFCPFSFTLLDLYFCTYTSIIKPGWYKSRLRKRIFAHYVKLFNPQVAGYVAKSDLRLDRKKCWIISDSTVDTKD